MVWITLCFLYRHRPIRDVLAHWAGNLQALGLRGTVKLREHHSWDALKRGQQRVWWAAHATRFGLYCVELSFPIRSRPRLLKDIGRFLRCPGPEPLEVAVVTTCCSEDSGPWFSLTPGLATEVFEAVRQNCYREVTQMRILGSRYTARFEELREAASPSVAGSLVRDGRLWLDFYYQDPESLEHEPEAHALWFPWSLSEF